MSDLERAVSGPVNCGIQYNAQFHADFDAEVDLDIFEITYQLNQDFTMTALVTIDLSVLSKEIDAYMHYLLELI